MTISDTQVIQRITEVTTPSKERDYPAGNKRLVFTGTLEETSFKVSLRKDRLNAFVPLATGKLEATATGCLVFLEYSLYPITKAYLLFWTFFIGTVGVVVALSYNPFWPIASTAVGLMLIHWIVRKNFSIHLSTTRSTLLQILA